MSNKPRKKCRCGASRAVFAGKCWHCARLAAETLDKRKGIGSYGNLGPGKHWRNV